MKKLLSVILAAALVVSLVPPVQAAQTNPETLNIIKQINSTLAPGVTQDIVYATSTTTGEQLKYYVATADTARDDVTLNATYKNAMLDGWGLQTIPQQMAAGEKAHSDPNDTERYIPNYQAVAGVNGAYYNMSTGQPEGAFAMEGKIRQNANGMPFFAVLKDGTPVIGWGNEDWNRLKADTANPIWEAVSGHTVQVKDGKAVATDNVTVYPRVSVGVTADNKVVLVMADGFNAPTSVGATVKQMADILLANGCVNGLELDGGGSATYVARQEGDTGLSVVNRPSDGSPRNTSNGLMIVSTTPPSDVFDHAVLTAEQSYVTPESVVEIGAIGVSPAGTAADIPAGVSWQMKDAALGSVTQDGTFTAAARTGDAVVQMVLEGKVVGETTIHVVIPDRLAFQQQEIVVPFGKTVPLNITAYYGVNEVALKDGDLAFTLADAAIGKISGFSFTAAESGSSSVLTAAVASDASVTAATTIRLGRGSEVLFDFESGENSGDYVFKSKNLYSGSCPYSATRVVDATTGKVHSGNYALEYETDFSNLCGGGFWGLALYYSGETVLCEGATRLGMWIYVPDENVSMWARWVAVAYDQAEDGTIKNNAAAGETIDGKIDATTGWVSTLEESGWHYLSIDTSAYSGVRLRGEKVLLQLYVTNDRHGEQFGYNAYDHHNILGDFTFYIDDITVDYSDAVDDREPPIFSELNYANAGSAEAAAIAKGSIPTAGSDSLDFAARVAEDTGRQNATGLDPSSARAYMDGNEVPCSFDSGIIRMDSSQTLSSGVHTVKFSVCDKQGNYASIIRQINVPAGSASVTVAARDPAADMVSVGSVQYMDITVPAGKEVETLTARLDLDSLGRWELDHMDVAAGYTASWSMEGADAAENIATVTVTRDRSKDAAELGESGLVLASIPVRVYSMDTDRVLYTSDGVKRDLNHWLTKSSGYGCSPVTIDLRITQGSVVYADGSEDTFTGRRIEIRSELTASETYYDSQGSAEEKAHWAQLHANGAHVHTDGKATDKAPSCLETGYTGRVFCTVCNSPVIWGETVPATGHTWAIAAGGENDGKLACTVCGKLFTGVHTDGKTYTQGVPVNGWDADRFYVDGMALTGVQEAENTYYDFGEDGVCANKDGYTGFFTRDENRYYAAQGKLKTGWFSVLDDRYHAGEDGVLHTVTTTDERAGSCTRNGRILYDCDCGEHDETKNLWAAGHTWDADHVCSVCGTKGIDIAGAQLVIDGKYFTYTGSEIRPDHEAIYNGQSLRIKSDRYGEDGYISYSDNRQIGIGTIEIEGRGDFYGTISGTFEIVPASISEIRLASRDQTSVTIEWDKALGAEYYQVYQKDESGSWVSLGKTEETTFTVPGLEFGGTYTFRAASRTEKDGKIFSCVSWSNELEVALTHQWDEPTVVEPTCTEDGSSTHTCVICGETEEEILPKLGHDVTEWTVTKEPTIEEKGEKTGICNRCGEEIAAEISTLIPYRITVEADGHGTVTTDPETQAAEADYVTVTAQADEDYAPDTITVTCEENGETREVEVTNGMFVMPAADVTVTVTFKRVNFALTVAETENGSVTTSAEESKATVGDSVEIFAVPDEDYVVGRITITYEQDGQTKTAVVTDGKFNMPASDVTVSVAFKQTVFGITVAETENGTVTAPAKAKAGETVTVTATPDEGYELDQLAITYDGSILSSASQILEGNTFTMPESDVTVTAVFTKIARKITVEEAENGTVDVEQKAPEGDTVTVTATPEEDYEVDTITVTYEEDGEVKTVPVTEDKFTMPCAGVTVTAAFKRIAFGITVSGMENGTVTVPAKAKAGETVTVTAAADSGYTLDQLRVTYRESGEEIALSGNTFTMPDADVTVIVRFRQVSSGGSSSGGTGTGSGSTGRPGSSTEVKNPDGSTTTTETKKDGTTVETTTKTETKTDGTKVENTAIVEIKKDGTKVESTVTVETKADGTKVENTATVETKKDGTKVESTVTVETKADGTKVENTAAVETKTDGTTVESTAATQTKPDGSTVKNAATTTTNTDGSKQERVVETTVKADGTVEESVKTTETKADGSVAYEARQADGTTASATVDTAGKMEAEVVLTEKAVAAAGEKPIVLPLPEVPVVADRERAPTVKVELPAGAETAKVVVPVQKAEPAAVAVIVHPDGTEEVVRKSIVTQAGLSVPLESGATLKVVSNNRQFKDVKEDNWASGAVSFASSRELFQGTGEDQFSPEAPMTRNMLVTVLYRLEQGEAGSGEPAFEDVPVGQWYSDAVSWAVKEGIVTGYADGTFGGDDNISREQMAVLLYRCSGSPEVSGTLDFSDAAEVSDWARDALIWAQQNKIMQGSGGTVRPGSSASRAEVAQLMMNYVNYLAAK